MIKIALTAPRGKVGSELLKLLVNKVDGVELVCCIDKVEHAAKEAFVGSGILNFDLQSFLQRQRKERIVDLLLDFSSSDWLLEICSDLEGIEIAIVSGTTGFSEKQHEFFVKVAKTNPVLFAANFSPGMFVMRKMLMQFANSKNWTANITDEHHEQKRDAPSGTAIRLGQLLSYVLNSTPVHYSKRLSNLPAKHMIDLVSDYEKIQLTHEVFDPVVYAEYAIKACSWLYGKLPGMYSEDDFFNDHFSQEEC